MKTTVNQYVSVVFCLVRMQKSAPKSSYKGCLFRGHFKH